MTSVAVPGVRLGQKCTVEVEDTQAGENATFQAMIQDLDEERIYVSWPEKQGSLVEVASGSHIQIAVPTQGGATMFLDGEVARRVAASSNNPVAMLGVRVLAVGRQQHRAHFRLSIPITPTDLAVWCSPLTLAGQLTPSSALDGHDQHEGHEGHNGHNGHTPDQAVALSQAAPSPNGQEDGWHWRPVAGAIVDVSGGGVGLRCHSEVAQEALLRLRFPFPMGIGDFVATARVKTLVPLGEGGARTYKVGAAFEHVDQEQRERLARCVYRYQIEQRRRESAR